MSPRTIRIAFALLATASVAGHPGSAAADGRPGRVRAAHEAGNAAPLAAMDRIERLTSGPALSEQARAALADLSAPAPYSVGAEMAPAGLQLVVSGQAPQQQVEEAEAEPAPAPMKASVIRPQLSRERAALRSELRPWLSSLEGCFEGSPRLPEKLVLVVAIDEGGAVAGHVGAAPVTSTAAPVSIDPAVKGCIARTASRWHVAPRDQALSVSYRLVRRLVAERGGEGEGKVMIAVIE